MVSVQKSNKDPNVDLEKVLSYSFGNNDHSAAVKGYYLSLGYSEEEAVYAVQNQTVKSKSV